MRFRINKVSGIDKATYVTAKMQGAFSYVNRNEDSGLCDVIMNQIVQEILASKQESIVPLTPVEKHFNVSEAARAEINACCACALRNLEERSPLVLGETVISDVFTYLEKQWHDLPAGTAVLHRKTTLADLCYYYPEYRVSKDGLSFHPPHDEESALSDTKWTIGGVISMLGEGLIGGIGGEVAGLLFGAIFPPGVPTYFEKVYAQISKIVAQAVQQNFIHQINGHLNGVKDLMVKKYAPRKESGASKEELLKILDQPDHDYYVECIGPLKSEQFAKAGFSVFLVGASSHLLLIQEQILVDPNVSTPEQSSFVKTLKLNAKDYADFAAKTWKEISDQRKKYIRIFKTSEGYHYDYCDASVFYGYSWEDTLTGERGKFYMAYQDKNKKAHSGKEEATKACNAHIAEVMAGLSKSLGDPDGTIKKWRHLIDQPLPKPKF